MLRETGPPFVTRGLANSPFECSLATGCPCRHLRIQSNPKMAVVIGKQPSRFTSPCFARRVIQRNPADLGQFDDHHRSPDFPGECDWLPPPGCRGESSLAGLPGSARAGSAVCGAGRLCAGGVLAAGGAARGTGCTTAGGAAVGGTPRCGAFSTVAGGVARGAGRVAAGGMVAGALRCGTRSAAVGDSRRKSSSRGGPGGRGRSVPFSPNDGLVSAASASGRLGGAITRGAGAAVRGFTPGAGGQGSDVSRGGRVATTDLEATAAGGRIVSPFTGTRLPGPGRTG